MRSHIKKVAKLLTAPAVVLGLLVPALATTPAAAATDSYTFTNTNGTLNATGNDDGNQISVTPQGTNYTGFRLIKLGDPGQFEIANTSSGKCIYASSFATQKSCGQDGEQWHFRPVDGKPNSFGLVRRDTNTGAEYCLDNAGGLHLWGILANPNPCNGSPSQEWTIPASKAAEARSLALDYYADLCSKQTSTCSWTETSEGQPQALPRVQASSVWYNDTSDKITQVFTTIYHSGWSQSLSSGLSTSVGVSVPVQAMISAQLTATTTYQSDSTTINGVVVTVPAKNYGWVDFAAVGKQVTGTWTFDTDHQPWTTDATVTVPVVNSPAGSTMYVAHTSSDMPTSSTSPAQKPAVQTFAATPTSAKLDLPAGTHLAPTATGAEIADAQDKPIMQMQPGSVTDTEGVKHAFKLAVNGNTLTQTLEGVTGTTIEGTENPSSVTFGPGTFPGSTPLKDSAGKTTSLKVQPLRMSPTDNIDDACARSQGHTCSDAEKKAYEDKLKKDADWNKCVDQWAVGTAVIGAFGGALEGGVAGILPGGLFGWAGGASAGMVVCSF
ncbi:MULTISPECIES: RICIN domain-containing protein [Kitasatospora]|uniref:RICIN domain-containing protein n=1 Tax=Kitasatospora TaxID=2063 RepID=UPI000C713BE3|nr:RICIN domain-containing protein [Kitasatospora sp. GP30]MDH6145746.1 hypothetical protein [Kitasatospora sp. GP30]